MKTKKTSERRSPRSRIHACWRVLFAIIGVLDCSCFCYCYYYYHNDYSVDNNNSNTNKNMATKKMQLPKSCFVEETWQEHVDREYDAEKKKKGGLSFIIRQSMALSYRPNHRNIFFTVDNNTNITGTNMAQRCLIENSEDDNNNNHNQKTYRAFLLLHLGFGIFCSIEMVIRAREARRIVFENQAIAALEERVASTVAKVYQRRKLLRGKGRFSHFSLRRPSDRTAPVLSPTTTRTPKRNQFFPSFSSASSSNDTSAVHRCQNDEVKTKDHGQSRHDENTKDHDDRNINDDDMDMDDEDADKRNILIFLHSTFGLWLAIGVTCIFWLSLLPLQAYCRIIRIFLNDSFRYMVGNNCTEGNGDWDEGNLFDTDCNHQCGSDSTAAATCYVETLGDDTAWATLWITAFLTRWAEICEEIQDYLNSIWKRYLLGSLFKTQAHKKLHKNLHKILLHRPKLIWFRLGRILNIVKWVRFAGPLARMILKLQDQLRTGYSTFQKVRSVRNNRERRLQHPSLLLRDLRRIESFHKVETAIAAWPSQCSMLLETLSKEVSQYSSPTRMKISSSMATVHAEEFLRKSRERGRQITRQIQWLQAQLKRGVTEFSSSEIYDKILRLSKDVSRRHLLIDHGDSDDEDSDEGKGKENKARSTITSNSPRRHRSAKSRWYDFLHLENLLSSRDYLISPRSRFSVVWRITVTNCLILVLTRLSVSWYLTQTFHLSISQVISRLLVDCGTIEEDTKRKFRFVTDRIEEWHVGLSRAIPLVPFPKESLWVLCVPSSLSSKILLLLGSLMETFIDVVSFLDIFFWFFTGDLDISTGIVVPKAFFGRCILPGTLVQIIDHPTLPHFLPSLLGKLASITAELGWSRLVLWSCALVPALVHEVFIPLSAYFFRHFEEYDNGDRSGDNNDLLMTYAESFGYLPTRSSQMLERKTTHLWLRDAHLNALSSQSHSNSDNDDGDGDGGNIDGVILRPPSYGRPPISGILTPPGSPMRTARPDSSVHFARDVSMPSNRWDDGSPQSYGSLTNFDIGLSLSSHNLDDLNNLK